MVLSSKIGNCCGLCEKCPHFLEDPTLDIDYCRKSNTLQKLAKIEIMLTGMLAKSNLHSEDTKSYVISEDNSDEIILDETKENSQEIITA